MLSPLLLAYTFWRGYKDGGLNYVIQRLGIYPSQPSTADQQVALWIHAASVGEVLTVLPLLQSALADIEGTIVLTTNTPTGKQVVEQQSLDRVIHRYLPIDFPGACSRFIKRLNCRHAWIVETEIWPWLYAISHNAGTNITIINGRLSQKTLGQQSGILKTSYQQALASVSILARSEADKKRFIQLGAQEHRISVLGNLKFASIAFKPNGNAIISRSYVLLASTHHNEELEIATAWQQSLHKGILLVIAPRHPERGPTLKKQLAKLGVTILQRSIGQIPDETTAIYLADTLGEMPDWYRYAKAAFVGGSLIERGGHNVLEPARFGCPIVVGPHTHNFSDEVDWLRSEEAIHVANNPGQVVEFLNRACSNDSSIHAMSQRALTMMQSTEKTLDLYRAYLIER